MELTKQWVLDTLRNTKLSQGVHSYCRDGRYCAMGVLYQEALPGPWVFEDHLAGPKAVEIDDLLSGVESYIIGLNDNGSLSFPEIADKLEKLWSL